MKTENSTLEESINHQTQNENTANDSDFFSISNITNSIGNSIGGCMQAFFSCHQYTYLNPPVNSTNNAEHPTPSSQSMLYTPPRVSNLDDDDLGTTNDTTNQAITSTESTNNTETNTTKTEQSKTDQNTLESYFDCL